MARIVATPKMWRNWRKVSETAWLATVAAGLLTASHSAVPGDTLVWPFRLAVVVLFGYVIGKKI